MLEVSQQLGAAPPDPCSILFLETPLQTILATPLQTPYVQRTPQSWKEEIISLLQKQVICEIPASTEVFYSNMFIVPKNDGVRDLSST